MKSYATIEEACELMLDVCGKMPVEAVPISDSYSRVLAVEIKAEADVPLFDRSPYDGYAFRAADTADATSENPVTLKIIEETPAGFVPTKEVGEGMAVKILTGAPIPSGADAVTKAENTVYTEETVAIPDCFTSGENIVRAGEDVSAGTILAGDGERVDAAMAATFAAQGLALVTVYKKPRIGIISTGTELAEVGEPLLPGHIRNTNRYSLEGACKIAGAEPVYLGRAGDSAGEIAALMKEGFESCDMLLTTGGVSVGDYDLTPAALELVGAETIVKNIQMKPGGSGTFGRLGEKPIFCLSGNPASSMTCYYAVVLPSLRKLTGLKDYRLKKIRVFLREDYKKNSPQNRLIRGRLDLTDGVVRFDATEQGNVVIHSLIGCDALALIPSGSPPLPAGTELYAYLI